MKQTAGNGGLILMHAENGPVIDVIAADLVAAGTTDPIGLWVAPDDAHPNAQAHAIIARAVAPFLAKD